MTADLERCRAEQARCVRQLAEGHTEQHGLRMGLTDWFAEELELEYGLFTSFGDSGAGKLQSQLRDGGRDAARAPGLDEAGKGEK